MAAAIEAGSGVVPEVVGKPEPTLLQEAMRMLGSHPDETVMIGDGLAVDIQGGKAAGMHTLLVLSGKDSREDVAKSSIKPDHIFEDVAAVVAELKSLAPTRGTLSGGQVSTTFPDGSKTEM